MGKTTRENFAGVGVMNDHPGWRFASVVTVCVTLLLLQLITATSYDLELNGEAGTLLGVTLMATLLEWMRGR